MSKVIDVSRGDKKLVEQITSETKRVLLQFYHGIGDICMAVVVFKAIKDTFPHVHFDIAVPRGLDLEKVIPESIFSEGDWREKYSDPNNKEYDLIFSWNFPLEKADDLTKTKAEISCLEELGINPVCGYSHIKPKPLIAVHYQQTSIPWVANPTEETAKMVWDDIIAANCTPVECHVEHCFHNPENAKFPFITCTLRGWEARLDNLMSFLGSCYAFVGVVSGPFHLAMSILPHHRVMLMEKDLRSEHFTKIPIATADIKNYSGEVKKWLLEITRHYW